MKNIKRENQLCYFKNICKTLLVSAKNVGIDTGEIKSKKVILFEDEKKTIAITVNKKDENELSYEVSTFRNSKKHYESKTPYFVVKKESGKWHNVTDYNSHYFNKYFKDIEKTISDLKISAYDFS